MYTSFYVQSTQCNYVFLRISEQTGIISTLSVNRLVFVTEKECVYCAVRTEYSGVVEADFTFLRG
jgi:hypothetical protein